MIMMTAKQIRELRKALGVTAKQLGEMVGVTESCVCYWERDESHPTWKTLVKLNKLAEEVAGKAVAS